MRVLCLTLLLITAACGASGNSADADLEADADPSAPDAGSQVDSNPLAPDASSASADGSTSGADAQPSMPGCFHTCQGPADCVAATTTAITDADNYLCENQRCRYRGCNSTNECEVAFPNLGYVCGTVQNSPIPACYKSCSQASQCSLGSTLYDGDNWACDNGKCRWTGCNSTTECQQAMQSNSYACVTSPGSNLRNCFHTCSGPSDCALASPLFDADNYTCEATVCRWQGCNSTSECTTANSNPNWVCE